MLTYSCCVLKRFHNLVTNVHSKWNKPCLIVHFNIYISFYKYISYIFWLLCQRTTHFLLFLTNDYNTCTMIIIFILVLLYTYVNKCEKRLFYICFFTLCFPGCRSLCCVFPSFSRHPPQRHTLWWKTSEVALRPPCYALTISAPRYEGRPNVLSLTL